MKTNLNYLKLLAKQYRSIGEVSTEIINLSAIINLPKGTEHFLADIHGEHQAFEHVMRNASGVVKRKIDDVFGQTLNEPQKKALASLIYYPKDKLAHIKTQIPQKDLEAWYQTTLYQLVQVCRAAAYKYTRSKVRKAIPESFQYIIEELLHENETGEMKQDYYQSIIDSLIDIDRADAFIVTISQVIRRLVVDHLHIIGDVYDRGAGAHHVMETLIKHHSVDMQWGNHDVLWIGAACGSEVCMADALRISLRYGNLETLEEGYGINLSPLVRLAMDKYCGPVIPAFHVKGKDHQYSKRDLDLMARMQKAIAVIQFKLEGAVIKRHTEFKMDHRMLLNTLNLGEGTIEIEGQTFQLTDVDFPTIDPQNPYQLTPDEQEVIEKLKASFKHSTDMQEHLRFMIEKGSMYKVYNGNLLYHGGIPLDHEGQFATFMAPSEPEGLKGKALLDYFDSMVRRAYYEKDGLIKQEALDYVWYLWCGEFSPIFGKNKMATFERYFIEDKVSHKEIKNHYYNLREEEAVCHRILEAFDLDIATSHIINGHVPVKVTKGEMPIKANGRLITIDGGFSKAYQKETGIAGFTLIFNSKGMALVSHEPFESREKSVVEDLDMVPTTVYIESESPRFYVGHTDIGLQLKESIEALKDLLQAYRMGLIKQ